MSELPKVTQMTTKVKELLSSIQRQKEQHRLFEFLNGLKDDFHNRRSQLLLLIPLPSLDVVVSLIQQEEAQKKVLQQHVVQHVESSVMYNRIDSGSNYKNKYSEVTVSKMWH